MDAILLRQIIESEKCVSIPNFEEVVRKEWLVLEGGCAARRLTINQNKIANHFVPSSFLANYFDNVILHRCSSYLWKSTQKQAFLR